MESNIARITQEITVIHESPTHEAIRRLLHHRSAQVGMVILGIMVLCAIFAKLISPYDPTLILRDVTRREGPCIHLLGCPAAQPEHIFGIDGNSRDLFSRIIFGTRWSLIVGVGLVTSSIIMRTMDVMLAFPSLLLALAVVTIFPPIVRQKLGALVTLVAIAIVDIPQ